MKPDMIEAISLVGQSSGRAGTLMNSSEELVARRLRGEDEAFRLIFDRYGRPKISFIYDMVGRRELAEELTQETFVRAHKNLKALRDDTKPSTWLFGIAKNVAREPLPRRHRELDQKTASRVTAHTETCAECASFYREMIRERDVYARYQRDVEVTPVLWASIETRIKQQRAAQPEGQLGSHLGGIVSRLREQ